MTLNDMTFGHADFVDFARVFGYGITDPLTVFSREKEFTGSEHHFYRVAEAFSHYTQKYIDESYAQMCVGFVRDLSKYMIGYGPEIGDGKSELKTIINLLMHFSFMDLDNDDKLIMVE